MEYEKERVKSPTSECNQKLKVNVESGKTRTKVKVREPGNEVSYDILVYIFLLLNAPPTVQE